MRVTCFTLGIRGGEDGKHQHESSNDLSGQTSTSAVAWCHCVRPSSVVHVERMLELLH